MTQEELRDRLRAVSGVSEQEFQLWRHHPVTRVVLRFLGDQSDAWKLDTMAAFMGGGLTALLENEIRGRIVVVNEILQLSFPDIAGWYQSRIVEPDAEQQQ